jgi:hypothetical protein
VKGAGSSSTTTFNRNLPDPNMVQQPVPQCPPGIPCNNIRQYQTPQPQKKDDDDVDDDGDN